MATCALIQLWLVVVFCCWMSVVQQTGGVSDFPKLLMISFDGFRADYVNRSNTPNLHRLMTEGSTAPWIEPRFISKTFPNHYSIATGLYEESHGMVANNFYDPVLNDTFDLKHDSDPKWWDAFGAVPLWVTNQRADPQRHSGGMLWPGTDVRIANEYPSHYWPYASNYSWIAQVDGVIDWLVHPTEPVNCVFMYFNEPDSTAHEFGPFSPQVDEQIALLDNMTGYLISRLTEEGLYDHVNLIFTSDHGMSEVPDLNIVNFADFVNGSLYRHFGNPPVYNILPNPGQEELVYDILLNASKTRNFTVYKKEDIPDVYHYKHNRRIMPIVAVADVNWNLAAGQDWYKLRKSVHGAHGYNNSSPDMRAYFIGHGPGFKKGFVAAPFRNLDLYPLACHLLGLTPRPNNGSLDAVLAMLAQPPMRDIDSLILIVVVVILCLCLVAALFAVAALRRRVRRKALATRLGTSRQKLLSDSSSSLEADPSSQERARLLAAPVVVPASDDK